MKILSASQLKELDLYTIEHEPILSIDLMERASSAFVGEIVARWSEQTPIKIFAGPGNNGGDALAVARLLAEKGYKDIHLFLFNIGESLSEDCKTNKVRLQKCTTVKFDEITTSFTPPALSENDLVIDGLFGTGLSRPLNGGFASVVKYINSTNATVVSIDVPSGLMCDDNTYNVMNHIVKADYTFTFQFPKMSFFFPENEEYVGKWKVLDIGIIDPQTEISETTFYFTEKSEISALLKNRSKFAHKGTVGNALLIAGKRGMAGAAILASKACMRAGAGKLTLITPDSNTQPVLISVPEVVVQPVDDVMFTTAVQTADYDALGIGPGIGKEPATAQAFIEQISRTKCSMVIDADALNIIGDHRGWITQLPRHCILTPHKKELFGLISTTRNSYEELIRTRELAIRQQIHIVIKGAYSAICAPDGTIYFNSTGNPGMATAGSGDVLTGIILGLLAQGYSPLDATRLGVYLHGHAGDIAAETLSYESLMASDIVENISSAFKDLRK